MGPQPSVSVIIPCRNEERTIPLVLEALDRQTYPREKTEILIADGRSTDGTIRRIEEFRERHPNVSVRWIDNPGLTAPSALNAGLRESTGEIIVRMDAHAVPARDYVEQCVRALSESGCDVVGGQWEIRPGTPGAVGRAIAAGVGSLFGAGGVRYRTGGHAGEVDTVPFGAFRRVVFNRVGFFNEQVPVNEDYEFFYRVRAAGGKIHFTPEIRTEYIARGGWLRLAAQYFSYGHQKAVMLSFHPRSVRIRQLIPAMFTLCLAAGAAAAGLSRPLAIMLGALLAVYGTASAVFSVREAIRRKDGAILPLLPMVFFCIHVSWGMGFWTGWTASAIRRLGWKAADEGEDTAVRHRTDSVQ
jgi:glycosyltransferase involved in cell wall biosynthesis